MRSTPRADRCGKSPYELICGMLPQGPISPLLAKLQGAKTLTPHSYVASLRDSLQSLHETVQWSLRAQFAEHLHELQTKCSRRLPRLAVGDLVFLKKKPAGSSLEEHASARILPRADPRPFEIDALVGTPPYSAVNLRDIDTKAGYHANPVSITRLIPYTLEAIATPLPGEPTRLTLFRGAGANITGTVTGQSATGAVSLTTDAGDNLVIDLSKEEYRWQ